MCFLSASRQVSYMPRSKPTATPRPSCGEIPEPRKNGRDRRFIPVRVAAEQKLKANLGHIYGRVLQNCSLGLHPTNYFKF